MFFPFRKTIIILSTFISQVVLAGGDQVLILCFGDDGHLAIETEHRGCPYGPFNKHGHPENIDVTASAQDSDSSPIAGCLDFPVSDDEEQEKVSRSDSAPSAPQETVYEIPPMADPSPGLLGNRVAARHIFEAEHLRILETVILLI